MPERRELADRLLCKLVQQRRMPVLGIGLGMQELNVVNGGGLFLHLPEDMPKGIPHRDPQGGAHRHTVVMEPGTRLEEIYGPGEIRVNSYHHQGIRKLAPIFRVAALAPDGLIEAFEGKDPTWWVIGVQWHPENEGNISLDMQLIEAFVAAAASMQNTPGPGQGRLIRGRLGRSLAAPEGGPRAADRSSRSAGPAFVVSAARRDEPTWAVRPCRLGQDSWRAMIRRVSVGPRPSGRGGSTSPDAACPRRSPIRTRDDGTRAWRRSITRPMLSGGGPGRVGDRDCGRVVMAWRPRAWRARSSRPLRRRAAERAAARPADVEHRRDRRPSRWRGCCRRPG